MPTDLKDVNAILSGLGYTGAQIDHAQYEATKLQVDIAKDLYQNVKTKIKIKQKTELALLVTLLLLENKVITEMIIKNVNAEIASRQAANTIK
jgi:hypothetical protein